MTSEPDRRPRLRAGLPRIAVVLLVVALLTGCGSDRDPSGPDRSGSDPTTSVGPTPSDGFPTKAFRDLSEERLDASTAARLQQALDDVAGGVGMTATLMTGTGTWTGATGKASGDRPMEPSSQMAIGSITKTIVAAQVVQLVETGRLDLDDPASEHLPPEVELDTNGATIEDLLSMRSGIPDYVDALYEGLRTDTRHVWTPDAMLDLVPDRRNQPGANFEYSSTNYLLLGLIIERATGRSVAQTLRDGVLAGPGLSRLVYQPDEHPDDRAAAPGGAPALPRSRGGGYLPSLAGATAAGPAGGVASDSATLARWWGRLCGGLIVSQESLTRMTAFDRTPDYGLGLQDWSSERGPFAVGNEGLHVGFVARAECIPELGAVVVVLVNNDEKGDPGAVAHALTNVFPE